MRSDFAAGEVKKFRIMLRGEVKNFSPHAKHAIIYHHDIHGRNEMRSAIFRSGKAIFAVLIALLLLILALLFTVNSWLPRVASVWLPSGSTLALRGTLGYHNGTVTLPGLLYRVLGCQLATLDDASLDYDQGQWRLHAAGLELDTACLSKLPENEASPAAPRTLADWQAVLPATDIVIDKLVIAPYENWSGAVHLTTTAAQQTLTWQGENLSLDLQADEHTLNIRSFSLNAPGMDAPVTLTGTVTLPLLPNIVPETGELTSQLALAGLPSPLTVKLNWQQQQGELKVLTASENLPLAELPWTFKDKTFAIHQGKWRWSYAAQPFSGGVTLSLSNVLAGLSETIIDGRFNVLTQGRGGKGNVVLTVGPGKLDWTQSHLPFQLTGDSKLADLLFFARIPGEVQGPVLNPQLNLKPGALLRMRGRLLSTLEVDEARWPLAGVTVSSSGIDGRLQAILTAHDPQMGRFRLHLDGGARQFWPDKGVWLWRYWGEGYMAPLAAKWDVNGRGRWQDSLIQLTSLSTGFDHIGYGSVDVRAPRLTLTKPLNWQRDPVHPAFNGQFTLTASQTQFSYGGYLPPATLTVDVKGRDPASFIYRGNLNAEAIGPVRVHGRWDGERLRGQAWWPQQSLLVFQPLISNDLNMKIQGGTLKAQVAFSAAAEQGFEAGGHWVVREGSVWMPDNEVNGVDFSLPFRFKDHQWYFGAKGPVALRIKEVKNQFSLQNITADLQGWYPWNDRQPLLLSQVAVDVLGGKLSLESLQMPQTKAATIRLENISLSELVTAVKPKQIAMSGHINGALPLWLNHSRWLIQDGWIANSGPLTVRMDKDFADAIASNNIAAGAAIDWLRYMEISRSWATIDLNTVGALAMKAQVNGTSRFSDKNQRVSLNYTQQENLFQLWRSLRFGDNLQSWVEQHATLPAQKEHVNATN